MRKFLIVISSIFAVSLILALLTQDKQNTPAPAALATGSNQAANDPDFFTGAEDDQFTKCGGALAVEDLLHKKGFRVRTWCSKSPDTLIVDNPTLEQDRTAYQLVQRKDLSALIVRVGFTKLKFAAAQPNGRLIYTPPFLWDTSEKRFVAHPTGRNDD